MIRIKKYNFTVVKLHKLKYKKTQCCYTVINIFFQSGEKKNIFAAHRVRKQKNTKHDHHPRLVLIAGKSDFRGSVVKPPRPRSPRSSVLRPSGSNSKPAHCSVHDRPAVD